MQDIIPQTLDEETVVAATKDIPDSLLKQSLLTGTPDEVVDQAAGLRDSGLRYAVLCNMSFAQPNMRRGMAASIPFTRILRQLRDAVISVGAEPLQLAFGVALDQQRDIVAQRSAVESGVHIVDDAFYGFLRNRGVPTGETRHYLVDDRLFAQLDHTRSFTPVHQIVNLFRP